MSYCEKCGHSGSWNTMYKRYMCDTCIDMWYRSEPCLLYCKCWNQYMDELCEKIFNDWIDNNGTI